MPSLLTRILLFLSSYFPLSVIFFIHFMPEHKLVAFSALGVGIIGLIGIMIYLHFAKGMATVPLEIKSVSKADSETMSYIVSYIIPFIAIPWDDPKQAIGLAIFFFVLGILYINSNMIHINPMLYMCRFHLYQIENEAGDTFSLLSKKRIRRGQKLQVIKADDDILLKLGD